ncbi:Glycine receptor subunit alphaZ1 [Durusdinium trenchii]|uniref:Glycine receptor subunit alphaZ1 n=1 Tax=Durusdinium trenchii TaxID=1381693 RepID=A0ABP0K4Z3_9DINO
MANVDAQDEEAEEVPCLLLNCSRTMMVRVQIHQILSVDLHEETFTLEFDAFFRWQDPRLRNWQTRLWLPESSTLKGQKTCKSHGRCLCKRGRGVCSGLPFVEGIFREAKDSYIKVDGCDEEMVDAYIAKEEPNFEDFGNVFGEKSSLVSFSKLMEEPLVLTEHQRLTNGTVGEVILFRKMRATFKENMELKHFPLDRQLLQFAITASVPSSIMVLEVDEKFKSICRVDQIAEYVVDKEQQKESTLTKKKTTGNAAGKEYSQLKATVHLERKPGKYFVNIVVMLYLLIFASFGTFMIDVDSPGDRISIIITFVLTIMALKYVINDQLPGKDYQTWLDLYLLSSYIFLIVPAVELLILKAVCPSSDFQEVESAHDKVQFLDMMFAYILFGVWNAFHIVLLVLYSCNSTCLHQDWEEVRKQQDDKECDSCWQMCDGLDYRVFSCADSDNESSSST